MENHREADSKDTEKGSLKNPALGHEYFYVPGEGAQERTETSRQSENDAFAKLAEQINGMQERAKHDDKLERGFHAKHQGCMAGQFIIFDDKTIDEKLKQEQGERLKEENIDSKALSQQVRQGLFSEPASFNILARYSNGVGIVRSDDRLDVRGLAFKVLEKTDGSPLPDTGSKTGTQDFLMTNMPVPMGKDAFEFMDFAKLNSRLHHEPLSTILQIPGFAIKHPQIAKAILQLALEKRDIPSMTSQTFWGGSPYRLGSDEQGSQAIKFLVKPQESFKADESLRPPGEKEDESNYLRQDLKARVQQGDIKYNFYVQLQTDPNKTPIENSLVEWKEEDSMPIPVGELRLFKGQDFDTPEKQKFCNSVSLTPWHYVDGHKPIGNLNRGRQAVYQASSSLRVNHDAQKQVKETNAREVESVFGKFPEK